MVDALSDHPNQIDKSPYAYGWNNPVNLTDPDGNCPVCPPIFWYVARYVITAAVAATATYVIVNGVRQQLSNNGSTITQSKIT